MVDTLKELLHSSLSERSRKQYSRAWVVFSEFYTRYQSADLHFPVSTACIALFISFLCAKGLTPATITSCLSAIAYVHKIKGYLDPTKSFLIEKLLVALGRCGQADVRMPISRPLLYELVSALQHTSPSAYRRSLFWAMFMTAFYGFFRIGELSCASKKQVDIVLQFDHVTFLKQYSRVTAVKIVITKGWFPYDRKRSQTIADRRRSRIVDRRRSQRVLFPYNRRRSQTIAEPTVALHFVQRKCHMYSRVVPAGKSKQTTWRTSRRKFCCKQIYFFF